MGTKHAMHMDIRAITAYHPAHALTLTRAAAPTGVRATMPIEREPGARLRARTAPCSEAGTARCCAWRAARLAQSVNPSLRAMRYASLGGYAWQRATQAARDTARHAHAQARL